jgi:hypothetical protein
MIAPDNANASDSLDICPAMCPNVMESDVLTTENRVN